MKPKQLIALLLALLTVALLLAGCEKDIIIQEETETVIDVPKPLDQSAIDAAIAAANGDRDAAIAELLPEGVTVPQTTKPAGPPPTTMPPGTKVQSSEVYPHVKKAQDTFNSGVFYLKATGAIPMEFGGGGTAPFILAADKNKMCLETEADWTNMTLDPAGGNSIQTTVSAAIIQTALGRKMRLVMGPESFIAFPEKKLYIDFSAFAEGGEDLGDLGEIAKGLNMFGDYEVPKNVESSKIKSGGKEYLCGTIPPSEEGGLTVRYYFLDGELKRIEQFDEKAGTMASVLEIEAFNNKPDPALFTSKGYRVLPLTEMMKLFEGVGDLGNLMGGAR